jgi:hypothetical protein
MWEWFWMKKGKIWFRWREESETGRKGFYRSCILLGQVFTRGDAEQHNISSTSFSLSLGHRTCCLSFSLLGKEGRSPDLKPKIQGFWKDENKTRHVLGIMCFWRTESSWRPRLVVWGREKKTEEDISWLVCTFLRTKTAQFSRYFFILDVE